MRILITEDSPTQAEQLQYILERHGYEVRVAENGVQALALLAEQIPHLVISDIVMPEMDGYELCRRIRADERLADLPVVLLTSLADTKDVLKGLACGADSFITKPYSQDYLLAQVAQMLSDNQRPDGTGATVNVDLAAGMMGPAVTDRKRTVSLLISTYEAAVRRNTELSRTQDELRLLNDRLEDLVAERTAELSAENAVRRQAEEKLRSASLYTRSLIEASLDPLVTISLDGRITDVNNAAEEVTGVSREGLVGTEFSSYVTEPEKARAGFEQVLAKGTVINFPLTIRHVSGRATDVLFNASVYKNESGDVQGVFAAARDITERKKSLELIRNILENVDQGFIILDRDFRIQMANRAYCAQVKLPVDAIIGRHCYETSHQANVPCNGTYHVCAVKKAFATGQSQETTHTHVDAAGENLTVQVKAYPFQRDETGRILTVIETHIDTTEKQKLEEQLRQAQKMESIGTLAGGIAHDFNNILAAIVAYGDMTRMKMNPDNPLRRNVENMLEAAGRAAHLTRSLLTFSRKQIMDRQPGDLNQIIKKVEKFLLRVIGEDVAFTTRLEGGEIPVFVDAPQIEQVLMNLATNARDALPRGGALTIATERIVLDEEAVTHLGFDKTGVYALITVTDTGVGMPEEVQRRIFEPFFTTKEVGKGTGLGLAVAYGIIKQHDGGITMQSAPGQGTTFKIFLPLIASGAAEGQQAHPTVEYQGGTETILLAEDNELLRKAYSEILQSFGYTVIAAPDGEKAVRLFRENSGRIQLLLFDLIMPHKNGREAFEEIRKTRPDVRVLFTSGYAGEIIRQKGLVEEGMQIIHKPASPADLLKKIRGLLDQSASTHEREKNGGREGDPPRPAAARGQ